MLLKKIFVVVIAMTTFGASAGLKSTDVNTAVTVVWDNPDDYRDVESVNGIQKRYLARVQDDFEKYFYKELPKLIDEGQKIKVTVYDVDLAGDVRPMLNHSQDVRLVTVIYPPMMDIEYTVSDANGEVVKTSRKRLRDLAFDLAGRSGMNDRPLHYEKTMLKRWFRREFK